MMVEHQQPSLAEVLAQHIYWLDRYLCSCHEDDAPTISFVEHAEHVAAVWREACTITTVEELDALPSGSVVVDDDTADIWNKWAGGWSSCFDAHAPLSRADLLPCRLLWLPEWGNA